MDMRLHEITLPKKSQLIQNVLKDFEKYGWDFVEKDDNSAVGRHPTKNYVTKVYTKDSAFNEFVKLSVDHPDNPHFAKFYGRIKTVGGKPNWLFVNIEKLDKCSKEQLIDEHMPELFYLLKSTIEHGLADKLGYGMTELVINQAKQKYRVDIIKNNEFNDDIWNHVKLPSENWQNACDLIATTASKNGYSHIDAYYTNFMRRGSELVFVDPYIS
jgi:hypothetical protein